MMYQQVGVFRLPMAYKAQLDNKLPAPVLPSYQIRAIPHTIIMPTTATSSTGCEGAGTHGLSLGADVHTMLLLGFHQGFYRVKTME